MILGFLFKGSVSSRYVQFYILIFSFPRTKDIETSRVEVSYRSGDQT